MSTNDDTGKIYDAVGEDVRSILPNATGEEVRAYRRWYAKEKERRGGEEESPEKKPGMRFMARDNEYLTGMRSVLGDESFTHLTRY